ncbi:short-chain fatty acyl-CoA regulator family protein [Litoreibacter sp.]|nr:short-chain fatty acyl-CoA regulator family protein [Litoreibacter sp.]
MPKATLTGSRIRDRRLSARMKQVDLAKASGISASYLNLIEHNRRRIGGKLLVELAAALGVEPMALSQGADAALLEELGAVATQGAEVEGARIEEFVGRFPGWAKKITEQSRRIEALEQTLRGLNDRLTHDPVLSEKMHDVLGAVAAIRSTSSILVETPNIDAEWRARFHSNIDTESRRLAETSAAMAAHFDRLTRDEGGFSTPLEAVAAFFETRHFHISELEEGAHGALEDVLRNAPEFMGRAAQQTGRMVLSLYADDALALPMSEFATAAAALKFDPGALAREFNVRLPVVFRRLATLPRAPDTPEIGLVSCDAAGAILLRKPPAGFSLPRFGAACPLWPLFSVLRNTGVPERRLVKSNEGAVFEAYCIAEPVDEVTFDQAPVIRAYMLLVACDATEKDAMAIGSTCRVCAQRKCSARRETSILARES